METYRENRLHLSPCGLLHCLRVQYHKFTLHKRRVQDNRQDRTIVFLSPSWPWYKDWFAWDTPFLSPHMAAPISKNLRGFYVGVIHVKLEDLVGYHNPWSTASGGDAITVAVPPTVLGRVNCRQFNYFFFGAVEHRLSGCDGPLWNGGDLREEEPFG